MRPAPAFVLNLGALRQDGMGVTASELDGPGYQVALGFSEGSNPANARRIAKNFTKGLAERWRTEVRSRAILGCKPRPIAGKPRR